MNDFLSTTRKLLFSRIGIVFGIFCLAFFFAGFSINKSHIDDEIVSDAQKYPLLAHRLFEKQSDDMIINFTQLREVMNATYNEHKIPLGIYFEYLPTGASVGVNDQLQVEIGSLAKVPAVMGIYKEIEKNNLKPTDMLTITEEDLDDRFGSLWKKGVGAKFSVQEAIDYTLKQSDNTAASILTRKISGDTLNEVFNELDLPKTRTGPFPVMSPKSYASVFRNLYLSAYLGYESSSAILTDLTQTDFVDKLPAGVPAGVSVAHKIGVFRVAETKDIYSDCGIVYVPDRPYVMCIMVAADEDTAREEIVTYSKMIYSFVSQVSPSKKVVNK